MDKKTRKTVFDIGKVVVVINVAASVLMSIFLSEPMPMILGMWFATIISVLLFYELALTITRAVTMNPARASRYSSGKYFLRFFIYAVVLYVAANSPILDIYGAVIGILSVKISIYIANLVLNQKSQRKEE